MPISSAVRRQAVFGASDGLTIALGLTILLHGHPAAMLVAALGAGAAELPGMGAGSWLSDKAAGIDPALANGYAAFAACALPALPYLVLAGWPALGASVALVAVVASAVAWLRPEHGAAAFGQTYGVLAAAAALSTCLSLWQAPTIAVLVAAGLGRAAWVTARARRAARG